MLWGLRGLSGEWKVVAARVPGRLKEPAALQQTAHPPSHADTGRHNLLFNWRLLCKSEKVHSYVCTSVPPSEASVADR